MYTHFASNKVSKIGKNPFTSSIFHSKDKKNHTICGRLPLAIQKDLRNFAPKFKALKS
jgi:hypothetical protein